MAVGHGSEDASDEEGGGGLDVLLVARGAEPATLAREGQEVFVAAMVTADSDEAAIEVAAVQEFVDDLGHDGADGAEAGLVVVRVVGNEGGEVAVDALPEGRLARVAGAVEVHGQNLGWSGAEPKLPLHTFLAGSSPASVVELEPLRIGGTAVSAESPSRDR